MGARTKLNRAMINGCILVAGVAGYLTGSWLVFGAALVTGVALSLYGGDIRPKRKKP